MYDSTPLDFKSTPDIPHSSQTRSEICLNTTRVVGLCHRSRPQILAESEQSNAAREARARHALYHQVSLHCLRYVWLDSIGLLIDPCYTAHLTISIRDTAQQNTSGGGGTLPPVSDSKSGRDQTIIRRAIAPFAIGLPSDSVVRDPTLHSTV